MTTPPIGKKACGRLKRAVASLTRYLVVALAVVGLFTVTMSVWGVLHFFLYARACVAAEEGNIGALERILALDDPSLINTRIQNRENGGLTPFEVAVDKGQTEAVAWMLQRGARVQPNGYDGYGVTTPLHIAAESGHVEIAALLIEAGANVCGRTAGGASPLHCAADLGSVQLAELLIGAGTPVDLHDFQGETALHCAAFFGHVGFARVLLEHGADANARDDDNRTPLHEVVAARPSDCAPQEAGRIKMARLLLDEGADPDLMDRKEKTPLDLARENGHREIVELLERYASGEAPAEDEDEQ